MSETHNILHIKSYSVCLLLHPLTGVSALLLYRSVRTYTIRINTDGHKRHEQILEKNIYFFKKIRLKNPA